MPPHMRRTVVSLIYKEKGTPLDWNNYRPISVSAAEYRIMARAIQLRMNEVLQHVISPGQTGFQPDKYIGECTAFAQLVAARCAQRDEPGLLLLLDGEKAYDRVQHGWLQAVLVEMGFPPDFCSHTERYATSGRQGLTLITLP